MIRKNYFTKLGKVKPFNKVMCSICVGVLIMSGLSCRQEPSKNVGKDLASSAGENKSQFEKVTIEYAKNFSVSYGPNYKLVHLKYDSPDRGVVFDNKLVLLQRDTEPPKLTGELKDAWLIEVPLNTVAANDDGEVTRLKVLGLMDNIVAMDGGAIYDSELRQRWEEKKIASIGYSYHLPPEQETVLSLNPDILILYSYNHKAMESIQRLRTMGLTAVPHFAWAEPSFLGKAEWLKFTALFFNKEKEANELYKEINVRCEELMEKVRQKEERVNAFLVYHPSENSDWSAHRNDFYAAFIEAAGAVNVLADDGPTHAVGITNEKMLDLAKDADFWMVNSTTDEEWPPLEYLNSFKAYRNDRVYHYQKRTRYEHNAYDWYETPEVRPDLVLEDLVSIFYPDLLPNHELVYFEKVKLTKRTTNGT